MNHQNPEHSLHSSMTSDDAFNSYDSGPTSLNSTCSVDHNQPSPPLFETLGGVEFNGNYFGFRTRHLSCIEEHESDSFNSLVSDVDALSSNEMENSQWEAREFNGGQSMNESYCSGLYQSVQNGIESPNKFQQFDCYDHSRIIEDQRKNTLSPYKEFENGLMYNYPAAMINSCYGSLSPPVPCSVKVTDAIANEPIYAVIDKEIQHKSKLKQKGVCGGITANENNCMKDMKSEAVFTVQIHKDTSGKDELPQNTSSLKCPSCHMHFDNDKRRKLIDSCGHDRCYSCMFSNEKCPFCNKIDNTVPSIKGNISERMVKSLQNKSEMVQSYESIRHSSPERNSTSSLLTAIEVSPQGKSRSDIYNEPESTSNDSLKDKSPVTTPSHTPKKRNFTAKGFRKTFGGGHRRTSSQGSLELPPSLNEINVLESSFHSDSAVSKVSKRSSVHHYNHSKGNGIHFPRSVNAGHLSTLVFGKIKSLWNAQSNNAGLNQLADVKDDRQGDTTNDESRSENVDLEILNPQVAEGSTDSKPPKKGSQSLFSNRFSTNFRTIKDWKSRKSIPKAQTMADSVEKPDLTFSSVTNSLQSDLQYLALKPLFFEVPLQEADPPFVGRQWILRDIFNTITATEMSGVLISGGPGSGKTSLILQLVDYSCFGRKNVPNEAENGGIYCQINVCHERIKSLASQVVAYHFCQAENNRTCMVPDFVHSLAAQLCQAPQLTAYREYLLNAAHLQNILCMNECIANPELVMVKGILEPLASLKAAGKINVKQSLLLIDALCEAEAFQSDYGFTLSSFLSKVSSFFPSWFKVIATIRNQQMENAKGLPYMKLSLDNWETNESVQKDLNEYIAYRLKQNQGVINGTNELKDTLLTQPFVEHLSLLARGCFLYVKLALDLIEKGQLSVKSTKSLPASLTQLYLQSLNNQFSSPGCFEKVSTILSICLASLTPLTLSEIFYSLVALNSDEPIEWSDFLQRFKLLNDFLVKRIDNTYMFFHPSFRDWLMGREDGESCKYLTDYRKGHYAIAFRLSRLQAPLDSEQTLELAYHILKARVYRCLKPSQYSLRDIQAYWIASASSSVSNALCSLRNIYNPDIKVCQLLLLAGANPNMLTSILGGSTILCIAAYEGMTSLVSTLLEAGADVAITNEQGRTPLILASMQGHLEIVRLLIAAGSKVGQSDNSQRCSLVYAVDCGRKSVVKYLLKSTWNSTEADDGHTTFEEAINQSLLVAVDHKYLDIVEDLLDTSEKSIDVEDPQSGNTALIKAASQGHVETVSLLLSRGAQPDTRNREHHSALLLAARNGHCSVVETLLERSSEIDQCETETQKTALLIAAEEGHLDIVKILVEKGANIEYKDVNGLTALLWACFQGRFHVVKYLLEKGADVKATDNFKRGPLDFASYQAPLRLVNLLLSSGAIMKTNDINDVSPLDRAVACRNITILQAFLKAGASVGSTTWTLAEDSPDILLLLLNHTVKEGNASLKCNLLAEAAAKFQFALDKITTVDHGTANPFVVTQLLYNLLLSLARCKRKMNNVQDAIHLSTRAIALIPLRYEGYYVRAKAYFVSGSHECALRDIDAALERASNTSLYIKDILERTKLEIENRDKNLYGIIVKESTDL